MKLSEKLPYAAAAVLFLAGIALRFVPGVRFSGYLCLGLAGLCVLWILLGRWAKKSSIGKQCKRLFLVCLAAQIKCVGNLCISCKRVRMVVLRERAHFYRSFG